MCFATNYLNYRCQAQCILHLAEVICQEVLLLLALPSLGAAVGNVALHLKQVETQNIISKYVVSMKIFQTLYDKYITICF